MSDNRPKVGKLSKSTKSSKEVSKNRNLFELSKPKDWGDFVNGEALLIEPGKDAYRKRFAYTMLQWADKETSIDIVDFCIEMRMARRTLYEWIDAYPDIKESYELAKMILGSRRRKGALTKVYDKDVAFKDMHKYDSEWIDINKYNADLKSGDDEINRKFAVYLTKPIVMSEEDMKGKKDDK